jgi:hypothetical protein
MEVKKRARREEREESPTAGSGEEKHERREAIPAGKLARAQGNAKDTKRGGAGKVTNLREVVDGKGFSRKLG